MEGCTKSVHVQFVNIQNKCIKKISVAIALCAKHTVLI